MAGRRGRGKPSLQLIWVKLGCALTARKEKAMGRTAERTDILLTRQYHTLLCARPRLRPAFVVSKEKKKIRVRLDMASRGSPAAADGGFWVETQLVAARIARPCTHTLDRAWTVEVGIHSTAGRRGFGARRAQRQVESRGSVACLPRISSRWQRNRIFLATRPPIREVAAARLLSRHSQNQSSAVLPTRLHLLPAAIPAYCFRRAVVSRRRSYSESAELPWGLSARTSQQCSHARSKHVGKGQTKLW